MTSHTVNVSRHIHADSRQAPSAESLIDAGGESSGSGGSSICQPGHDGDVASLEASTLDDLDRETPHQRQAQNTDVKQSFSKLF